MKRQCTSHTIAVDFAGLAAHYLHSFHRPLLGMLQQSARTRPFKGFRRQLVVLAVCYWPWTRSYCQRQMGRPIHHCLDRVIDSCPIVGSTRRYQNGHSAALVQAFSGSILRSRCSPHYLLYGTLRNPLCMPCKSWRR